MSKTTIPTMNDPISTGRDIDLPQLRAQLGWNLAAISGGRITWHGPSCVLLPVGSGYRVAIILEANDTYTVRRIHIGTRVTIKGEVSGVYCEQLAEIAYQASCFHDGPFGS